MFFTKSRSLLLLVSFLLVSQSTSAQELDHFFTETESFKRAHIGISVVDLETGKEVYSRHEDQYFVPASLQKIPLSTAAITFLGDEYRFSTELQYEGKIDRRGTLHGNIWIVGGADPSLSLGIFSEWEGALKQKGIFQVHGKVIVDATSFETALASPYWYFEDLGNYYGAGASGLSINENLYRITFEPGKQEGDPAQVIKIDPPILNLIIHNEVITGPAGSGDRVYVFGTEYSPVQFYRGTVPIDQPTLTIKALIPDPPLFCGEFLNQAVHALQGVEVIREKTVNRTNRIVIAKQESLPLKDLLQKMNKESNNLYAEHFCKAIGNGSSLDGIRKIEQFLKEQGIPAKIRDGAGLARSNLMTPKGFVALLSLIQSNPLYHSLYLSFPEPESPGTLKSFPRLSNASLKAKTGFMTGISCLGGYLTLPSGKEYAFSIFCNHYDGSNREVKNETYLFLERLVQTLE